MLEAREALYEQMLAEREARESRDLCNEEFLAALREAVESDGGEPHPDFKTAAAAPEGATVPHGGKKLKTIRGMGTVYDWRGSAWSEPNGPAITPRLGVQHIPVIHNVKGFGDLVTLNEVCGAQGLRVQQGTDAEGNVGLFTNGNLLCFQARGANQCSWGTEHMHFAITEPWSKKQLRASAWIAQLNHRKYGTPLTRWSLGSGAGVVKVIRGGQGTHAEEAAKAGFHDRIDPGHGYDFEYVDHCVAFFDRHGHFEGA
jgi:hypothetical protein